MLEKRAGWTIRTIHWRDTPTRNGARIVKKETERLAAVVSVRVGQRSSLFLSFSLFLAFGSGLCQSRHIVGKCYSCSCYLSSEAESDHDPGDPSLAHVRARSCLPLRESGLFPFWDSLFYFTLLFLSRHFAHVVARSLAFNQVLVSWLFVVVLLLLVVVLTELSLEHDEEAHGDRETQEIQQDRKSVV